MYLKCVCMCTWVCVCACVLVCVCMHMYLCVCMCAYMYFSECACVHMYLKCECVCMCAYVLECVCVLYRLLLRPVLLGFAYSGHQMFLVLQHLYLPCCFRPDCVCLCVCMCGCALFMRTLWICCSLMFTPAITWVHFLIDACFLMITPEWSPARGCQSPGACERFRWLHHWLLQAERTHWQRYVRNGVRLQLWGMRVCVWVWVCMRVCMCVYACVWDCMCVFVGVGVYGMCVWVCMLSFYSLLLCFELSVFCVCLCPHCVAVVLCAVAW